MLTSLPGVLFDGVAYGSLLFLISIGLSVTMGLMRFINLAHGAFAMLGGYVCVVGMTRLGVPFLAMVAAAFLVAAAFGAVLEGSGGGGAPVAVAGAMMVGLGFNPFGAAVLCLIANTAPVAFGGVGNPIRALVAVTGLPDADLSAMVGRILPWTALVLPFWLIRSMTGWRPST